VTSQNLLQLLVSKKCDFADSIGSDLTSIELLFAYIAEVLEGLTAAFERRPDSVARKFARKLGFAYRILLEHFHFLALTLAAVLYSGFLAM
jgi:hypothetical protein